MANYTAYVEEYCAPELGVELERYKSKFDDVAADALQELFQPREDLLPPVLCVLGLVGTLAQRVESRASPKYVTFLLARMWACFGVLSDDPEGTLHLSGGALTDFRAVYDRLRYAPPTGPSTYPKLWFGLAWDLNVDLRPRKDTEVLPDWGFGEDFLFSETWAWAKYHCQHGTPEVIEAVQRKLDSISDGNLQIGLLRDLADPLKLGAPARALIERYRTSELVTDNGIEGAPTPTVGEEVDILLSFL